ncbi:MAG: hypothetical protein MK165_16600 [Pirellulaceae bacterium]|nr:hypothetical protein [Pirellulaceae bacterium]
MTKTNRTILVSASGSSIGLEVAKSLRLANRAEKIIGTEVSQWGEQLASQFCDETILVPRGDEAGYQDALRGILVERDVALAFINTEPELEKIGAISESVATIFSCPQGAALASCLDKSLLHQQLADQQLVAGTRTVTTTADIAEALTEFGKPIWLRCAVGPRGRGSIIVEQADEGAAWIEYWRRRGQSQEVWLAHEYLPGRNLNWTSIWRDGKLVVSSTGERLKYFLGEVAVSGITGNVSHCRLVNGQEANEVATRAIECLSVPAHGIFSVDLREDRNHVPRVTEINGRNAFRPLLYTQGGVNFPAILADVFLDDRAIDLPRYDAGKAGLEMFRGMDFEPLFQQTDLPA